MTYVLDQEQLQLFCKKQNTVANRVIISVGKKVSKVFVDGYFKMRISTKDVLEDNV